MPPNFQAFYPDKPRKTKTEAFKQAIAAGSEVEGKPVAFESEATSLHHKRPLASEGELRAVVNALAKKAWLVVTKKDTVRKDCAAQSRVINERNESTSRVFAATP